MIETTAARKTRARRPQFAGATDSECTVCGFNWLALVGESRRFCYHCTDTAVAASDEEIEEFLSGLIDGPMSAEKVRTAWRGCMEYVESMLTGV